MATSLRPVRRRLGFDMSFDSSFQSFRVTEYYLRFQFQDDDDDDCFVLIIDIAVIVSLVADKMWICCSMC